MICKPHQKENAQHPFATRCMQWLTEKSEEFPDLRKAGPPTEWALMASAGNSQTNSEGSASTITEAAIKLAVETMAQSIAILARRQNFLEPIQQQTTFKIEQPENSVFPEHLPPATITDLSVASACINNKIYDRQSLPDCVSLTDEEFAARNTPAVPSDLVDRTPGTAIYLYIDLCE